MNSFTRSGSIKKIIIAIIFIILFNWIYPCIPVYAEDTDTTTEEEAPFGVLLEPLMGLVSGLGEGIIWLIQTNILNIPVSSAYIDVNKGIFSFSIGDWEINVNEGGVAGATSGAAARIYSSWTIRGSCWWNRRFLSRKCWLWSYRRLVWR